MAVGILIKMLNIDIVAVWSSKHGHDCKNDVVNLDLDMSNGKR